MQTDLLNKYSKLCREEHRQKHKHTNGLSPRISFSGLLSTAFLPRRPANHWGCKEFPSPTYASVCRMRSAQTNGVSMPWLGNQCYQRLVPQPSALQWHRHQAWVLQFLSNTHKFCNTPFPTEIDFCIWSSLAIRIGLTAQQSRIILRRWTRIGRVEWWPMGSTQSRFHCATNGPQAASSLS